VIDEGVWNRTWIRIDVTYHPFQLEETLPSLSGVSRFPCAQLAEDVFLFRCSLL
jgi:hypothetical protein